MANAKLTALTEDNSPDGSDLDYVVTGAANSRKRYKPDNNFLPNGFMLNGKLSVTVASSNITVALKTKSGGNPSATDPVSVWINGSYRRCTASLSVTKNAGTNWFNSGASEHATQTINYFVYLIWNTTPATDIMDIGFARIPYGRVYSDFSGTTTNEKYLAYGNGSAPTSTDSLAVVGRFDATLSATASFNWSVPTFTNSNLVQQPIYETDWIPWSPTYTGFSADPTSVTARYQITGRTVNMFYRCTGNGTSNATTFTISLPFTAKTVSGMIWNSSGTIVDSGTTGTTPGLLRVQSAATTMEVFKDFANTAFTNSGNKRLVSTNPISYEIS